MFILTVPSSLDFKSGNVASSKSGKVAAVVWSREGADGYGRQETRRKGKASGAPAAQSMLPCIGSRDSPALFPFSKSAQVFLTRVFTFPDDQNRGLLGPCVFSLNKGK